MKHATLLAICVSGVAACTSDPIPPAELGEVCGEPGPFRVLALEPDEQLVYDRPLQVGDRVLYAVSTLDAAAPESGPKRIDTTVWATGPCGESPVQVASGIQRLVASDVWPGVVLGCHAETGDISILDPSGANEPRVLFARGSSVPAFGCAFDWTPHGVLQKQAYDDELGALVLQRYPADPGEQAPAPTVLLDPIRITQTPGVYGQGQHGLVLRSFDDFVLALTPDDELVRIELADGAVSTVRADVAAFEASPDGRYVLWQSAMITGDQSGYPRGKIFLRDQSDGSDVLLAETSLVFSLFPLWHGEQGIVRLGAVAGGRQRVFFLPGLEFVDVAQDLLLNAPLGGDLWLAQRTSISVIETIDLRTGQETPLFTGGRTVYRDTDALVRVETGSDVPVWRVPFDGSAPTRLAERATVHVQRLADGRLVSPLGLDEQGFGPLVLIEPEIGSEAIIDDQVFAGSLDTSRFEAEGIVRYSVSDGERSGVYLAKLP